MSGQIGFDEGGVVTGLLARPVFKRETEEWKYNKMGLPLKHWTTAWDVSLGDVLIPLVLGGFIMLTPLFLQSLGGAVGGVGAAADSLARPSGGPPVLGSYVTIYGNVIGPLLYAKALRDYTKT